MSPSSRKRVLAIVLAGGEGKRLMPLTADRAKPAVPFAGIYRLIDFALSNVVNSGYLRVVDYGDGWYPLRNVDELERRVPELNRMAEAAGKPKPEVSAGARPDTAEVERLRKLGVERVAFGITAGPRDEMLATLDEATGMVGRFA